MGADLVPVADSNDANMLTAAGRICLVMRDATRRAPLFRRAFERDPSSFRAALGMGSSALMQRDVDAAAKAFGDARNLTKDKDETQLPFGCNQRAEQSPHPPAQRPLIS